MDRRTYLAAATGVTVAVAGCADLGDSGDSPGDDDSSDDDGGGGSGGDDDYPELAGTFDDFEDLEPWDAFQDIGGITADTDRAYEGSQSARLTPDDEDGQVRVRRSLDEPIDVTDVVPGLAMTAEDSGIVLIQLQDEDGDYVEYSQQVLGDMPLTHKNFGLTRIRGEPDLEEIIVLQIIRWFGEETEEEAMWVDDFHFVPDTNPGKVMLQFHGGYENHYTEALSRVSAYDFTATAFVPTDRLRDDPAVEGDRLTHDQVADLDDAGWTIGAQPANGAQVGGIDPDQLEDHITEPAEWLEDEGYDGADYFSFPGSQYTEEAYELVREHYELGFAGQTQSQGYAMNPHLCSMVSNPAEGEAEELIEWTAENGGITSFAFYELEDDGAIEGLEETLLQLDAYVSEGDLEVISPAEMADEYVY